MKIEEYTKRFEKLYSLFTEAYLYFYVWKALQEKEYEKIYQKNSSFWSAVLHSLENTWLSFLAKIYEDSKYSRGNLIISVQALIPFQSDEVRASQAQEIIDNNGVIITNLVELRHNQLAHNNADHLLNPSKILGKHPIKYSEVEDLLKISSEVLSLLNPNTGHGYVYDAFADGCKNDVKNVLAKLEYFESLKSEHLEKFTREEIEDPRFPPGRIL